MANYGDISTNIVLIANQSIRRNAANTEFEAFTFTEASSGAQGVQGTIGSQGIIGTQGTIGSQGIIGSQGTIGTSIQGTVGSQGTIGTSVQGTAGAQGVQGRIGAQGIQGIVGAQGTIGAQGTVGSQGVQGLTGWLNDVSVNQLYSWQLSQDTSISNLRTKDTNIDISLNALWVKEGYQDTSINNVSQSVGNLKYGTEYQLAVDLSTSSTSATTPQVKVSMTTTNLPSGTYKITVHWMWSRDSASNSAYFDISSGTSWGERSIVAEGGDVTDIRPETRIFYRTLSGVNVITFNYWGESNINSTTVSDATIELIRVS